MSSQHPRGLTLIEIMVIIALIMVLAGLILPMLRGNREYARNRTCASNLNQIGKAMFMYADVPSNGSFPNSDDSRPGGALAAWGLLYNRYVADPRVFSCRAMPTPAKDLQTWTPGQPVPASCTLAYDPSHGPNDAVAAIAADKKGAQANSDNHGKNAGQNVLIGAGTVEFRDTVVNRVGETLQDDDIYSFSSKLAPKFESYIRQ
jgi:type II secretory pathway pseudopilin PulG